MKFCEDNSVKQLPIYITFGAAEYQKIRSAEPPILGDNPDIDLEIREKNIQCQDGFSMAEWFLQKMKMTRSTLLNLDKENSKSFVH